MDNRIFGIGNPLYTESAAYNPTLEEAITEENRFAKVFERFDAMQETADERKERLKTEAAQALEQKKRRQKISDLQGLISQLKAKLAVAGGENNEIQARLSAAQTELFWLMCAF